MSESKTVEKIRVVTPIFRASYVHLAKPAGMPKDPPEKHKYSVTMLFDKETELMCYDAMTKEPIALGKAIAKAKRNYFEPKFGPNKESWPQCSSPRQDGDDPKYTKNDGYAGNWVYKAMSNPDAQPAIVGPDNKTIINPNDVNGLYSGCYARAQILVRVWEYGGKYGVHFILDSVQKANEGKRFGGKLPATEAFGAIAAGSSNNEDDDDNDFGEE